MGIEHKPGHLFLPYPSYFIGRFGRHNDHQFNERAYSQNTDGTSPETY
jgi:hypothetical protein